MFAVQGWNVSAANLVPEKTQRSAAQDQTQEGNNSKKRKRADRDGPAPRKIEAGELDKLWTQRFGEKKSTPGRVRQHSQTKRGNEEPPSKSKEIKHSRRPSTTSQERGAEKNQPRAENTRGSQSSGQRPAGAALNDRDNKSDHDAATKKAKAITKTLPPPPPQSTTLTPLQAKMRSKLTSARFRHLNETLYTTSSATALSLFASSPVLFAEYHAGFSQQVSSSWPRNPVEDFISAIKARGPLNLNNNKPTNDSTTITPLPRRKTSSCTIADLGCGDAPLARALIPSFTKKLHLTIHSYDLHAPNQHVTVADISNLPLRDGEADIAIFCLSLMGTNWIDFVEEAWRILRGDGKGEVWVAEVKSRFARPGSTTSRRPGEAVNHSVGKRQKQQHKGKKNKTNKADEDDDGNDTELPPDLFTSQNSAAAQEGDDAPDLKSFINVFARRGFQLKPNSIDAKNKMFVSMTFFKTGIPTAGKHKGMKWTGKQYERVGRANDDDDEDKLEEGRVLKPCVYKTR